MKYIFTLFQGVLSLGVLLGLCLLSHVVPTPSSLPDIFAVLTSCYCSVLFMGTLAYFGYLQATLHSSSDMWECNMSQYMYQIVRRSNIKLTVDRKDHRE
jgi:hypothetical protein